MEGSVEIRLGVLEFELPERLLLGGHVPPELRSLGPVCVVGLPAIGNEPLSTLRLARGSRRSFSF